MRIFEKLIRVIMSRIKNFTVFLLLFISSVLISNTSFSQNLQKSLSGTIDVPAKSASIGIRSRGGAYRSRYGLQKETKKEENANPYSDIIVYLVPVEGKADVSPIFPQPQLNQKNQTFIPRVLPITVGTTVEIINEDKIYHNVFSYSSVQSFNIGKRPTGVIYNQTFTKAGAIQAFCNIHPNMSSYILVLDTPYFVRTDNEGYYVFNNIPAGKYWLEVFHPEFSAEKRQVTIKSGSSQTVDLTLR